MLTENNGIERRHYSHTYAVFDVVTMKIVLLDLN